MSHQPVFGVSDFVAVFNQTVEYAYPSVTIVGELANFRISKNAWIYFDLKDEHASVRFFGSVRNLPGPLEEGMLLKIVGVPRLHPQFGFSINVSNIQLSGEGTIKKAAKLLEAKLAKEGLFDKSRKRTLLYPPASVGLITSGESAAYADFIKVLGGRWGGIDIKHFDVQVQGESAPTQIVEAIEYFNGHEQPVDILVVVRGGGSADDLQAFSTELVTRSIAGSRVPTLVAIGHEIDLSLAELAADKMASTPSNAAELLVPDKRAELSSISDYKARLKQYLKNYLDEIKILAQEYSRVLEQNVDNIFSRQFININHYKTVLEIANPTNILKRGYAIVCKNKQVIKFAHKLKKGDSLSIQLSDGSVESTVN